jgi:hypothetical protein
MRPFARILLFAVVLAGPAIAQPPKPVRDELPEESRRVWDKARQLYSIGDFEAARAEYQRVYDATRNPRVLYNIAICDKDLKRFRAASEVLQRALGEKGKLSREDIADLEAALKAIEPFITKLEVTANEPGATLWVDGVELGTTPFTGPVTVDAGSHTVKLTKPGFADVVREKVTFATEHTNRIELEMSPLEKRTRIVVNVVGAPRASVLIDGTDMGPAPFSGEVKVGPHTIEARAEDFASTRQPIEVVYKEPMSLMLSLAPKRHEGMLKIIAAPEGSAIELDGRVVGHGSWEGMVSSGTGHQLAIKKDGYYTYATEVVVQDDQRRSLPVTLNPEKTWIWWVIGASAVVAGGIVAGYFALRAPDRDPVPGSLDAGGRGFGIARYHF